MERRFYNAVRDILSEKTAVEHKQGQSVAPRHGDWLKKKKKASKFKDPAVGASCAYSRATE